MSEHWPAERNRLDYPHCAERLPVVTPPSLLPLQPPILRGERALQTPNLRLEHQVSDLVNHQTCSPQKMENRLQVRPAEINLIKQKATEDAKQMQASVLEAAKKSGQDPPKYALIELIGKGSFGRVYKG